MSEKLSSEVECPSKVVDDLDSFRYQLTTLINTCSLENRSDTPDFILSSYLTACLNAFDNAVKRRTRWYAPVEEKLSGDETTSPALDNTAKSLQRLEEAPLKETDSTDVREALDKLEKSLLLLTELEVILFNKLKPVLKTDKLLNLPDRARPQQKLAKVSGHIDVYTGIINRTCTELARMIKNLEV
jgi:hypothetical protein